MKNKILQFIKKIRLCRLLKEYHLLFLLKDLNSFKYTRKLFPSEEKENDKQNKIYNFLKIENNLFWDILYDELSARPDLFPGLKPLSLNAKTKLSEDVLFFKNYDKQEYLDYLSIIKEIVETDYPQLTEQYNFFVKRLEQICDARFYGAKLEEIQSLTKELDGNYSFDIDWIKSNKQKLYISFETEGVYSSTLPLQAQKNLCKLFTNLLFEKKCFISAWQGIGFNKLNQICFLDFDFLYKSNLSLQNFAIAYIEHKQTPKTIDEFKLQRAIELLQKFCSDINIFEHWKNNISHIKTENNATRENKLLQKLQYSTLDIYPHKQDKNIFVDDVQYLLDKSRHLKGPNFKKSSIYYWLPLLIMIIMAYYFL